LSKEQVKKCIRCEEVKGIDEFNKCGKHLSSYCKKCRSDMYQEEKGEAKSIVFKLYRSQKGCSITRGMPPPNYTRDELFDWILSQPHFEKLRSNYIQSGFDKYLVPSCDRLNERLPYTLDNIELVTWGENFKRSIEVIKSGERDISQPIIELQYPELSYIAEHPTYKSIRVKYGVSLGDVCQCCKCNEKMFNDTLGDENWHRRVGDKVFVFKKDYKDDFIGKYKYEDSKRPRKNYISPLKQKQLSKI